MILFLFAVHSYVSGFFQCCQDFFYQLIRSSWSAYFFMAIWIRNADDALFCVIIGIQSFDEVVVYSGDPTSFSHPWRILFTKNVLQMEEFICKFCQNGRFLQRVEISLQYHFLRFATSSATSCKWYVFQEFLLHNFYDLQSVHMFWQARYSSGKEFYVSKLSRNLELSMTAGKVNNNLCKRLIIILQKGCAEDAKRMRRGCAVTCGVLPNCKNNAKKMEEYFLQKGCAEDAIGILWGHQNGDTIMGTR